MEGIVLSETSRKRIDQLAAACKAIDREIRKLLGELASEGVKFPSALPLALDLLSNILDAIFVILNKPHIEADASHKE